MRTNLFFQTPSSLWCRAWICLMLGMAEDSPAADAQEPGPDLVVVAESKNPQPDTLPSIRMVHEKLWGKYFPMISATFPNVPNFTCDSWCYEAAVDFVDARALDGGALEIHHRDPQNPQALVVTTITPKPGAVLFDARWTLDPKASEGAELPTSLPGLNLCWQLRHAPAFASQPDAYPEFVKRCFIFEEKGRVFLMDTNRTKIPVEKPDHPHNTPPWVQMYVRAGNPVPETPATSWAGYSADTYVTPVIGAVSRDGKYLTALANDSADQMAQAWHDCMHNNPKWLPEEAPAQERHWRLGIYVMENEPEVLLERVAKDFPKLLPGKP